MNYFGCSFESMINNTSEEYSPTYLEIFMIFKFLIDKDLVIYKDYKEDSDDIYHSCFFNKGSLYNIGMQYYKLRKLLADDLDLLHLWRTRSVNRVPDNLFGIENNTDLKAVISSQIKEISSLKHIAVKDLADDLNCTQAAISQYRKGTRIPSAYTLIKLARIFGISTDYLLGRSGSLFAAISKQQIIQSIFDLFDHQTLCYGEVTLNSSTSNEITIEDPILRTFCMQYAQYQSKVLAVEAETEFKKALLNKWITNHCANYNIPLLDQVDFHNFNALYQLNYRKECHQMLWGDYENEPDIWKRFLCCYDELSNNRQQVLRRIKSILGENECEDSCWSLSPDIYDEFPPSPDFFNYE